jgi:arabinofuranosyltransferase
MVSLGMLVTGNAFAATFLLSIILSIATIWLIMARLAVNFWSGILAAAALLLSKAFIDYSTSGLETPLTHFLLAFGVWLGFGSLAVENAYKLATASLIALLSTYLCRPELLLAVLPLSLLVASHAHQSAGPTLKMILIALAPDVCWSIFSLIYFRHFLPEIALAPLSRNLTASENFRQGLVYVLDSFSVDPITLTVVILAALLSIRQSRKSQALAGGALLYLMYVVVVGGDAMSGHLFTVPLVMSAIIVARSRVSSIGFMSIALVLALMGSISAPATILSGPLYSASDQPVHGIRDERGVIFPHQGLLTEWRGTFRQPDDWTPQPAGANSTR